MPTEKRRNARRPATLRFQIRYTDVNEVERFETVSARDVSGSGCKLILRAAAHPRSVAYLTAPPSIKTSATVRYQTPSARGFETGLEFTGGFLLAVVESLH
jgi:hypothetical protein